VSFGSPFALLALLVVPAVLAFAIAMRRRPSGHAVAFTNMEVLEPVLERRRSWRPWVPVALLLLALALAAGALARPHAMLDSQVDNATVVLLVDVSGSMRAKDVEPTRLDAAVSSMTEFLGELPQPYQVGLVQFNATPAIVTPPTHVREDVRQAILYLRPEAGTAIGDGLAVATRLVRRSVAEETRPGRNGTPRGAIILLSDGTQSQGRLTPAGGADLARAAGIPVYTVALGTDGPKAVVPGPGNVLIPVHPDPELMRTIAARTKGETFTARTAGELSSVFGHLSSQIAHETRSREITSWFVFAAAAVLLLAVALGRLLAGAVSA
jgi:Ca-activated chloride channel family protein